MAFVQQFPVGYTNTRGEMTLEVQNRVVAWIDEVRRDFVDSSIAAVSHADPIKTAVAYYAGIPLDMLERIEIGPGSVTVVRIADYGARILALNSTAEFPR
jgi:broad specificity phosphatase PhoE